MIATTECSSPDYARVLDLFSDEVQECEVDLKAVIDKGYEILALQRNPHLILLSSKYYTTSIKPVLCRWLGLWLEMKSTVHQDMPDAKSNPSSVVDRKIAQRFVSETDTKAVQDMGHELQQKHVSNHFLKLLNLGRMWVLTFVPHVLSKVNRVSYGLLREEDLPKMPANMASARKQVAVPFVGKDGTCTLVIMPSELCSLSALI